MEMPTGGAALKGMIFSVGIRHCKGLGLPKCIERLENWCKRQVFNPLKENHKFYCIIKIKIFSANAL